MAITARFIADFSGFVDAVNKAEVKLVDFSKGAANVEKSLNRMVDNFSGRKLIQDATLMVTAVEKIGGVSKLSQAELAKFSSVTGLAADKMKAMGIEGAASMQKISDRSASASAGTSTLAETAKKAALAFGALFTARAAISFGNDILKQASDLKDLSQQTHINVEDLQILAGAMSEFGVDADTLGKGLFGLSRRIAKGDDSVAEALQRMGLSLADVEGLNGEALFLKIMHGLSTLQGGLRDTTASDLFGSRLGMAMAGASEGIDDAVAKARTLNTVMGTETVDALDAYGESIERAKRSLTAMAANMAGPVAQGFNTLLEATQKGASTWSIFNAMMADTVHGAIGLGTGTQNLAKLLDDLNKKTDQSTASTRAAATAQTAFVGPMQSSSDAIRNNAKSLTERASQQKDAAKAAEKLKEAEEKLRSEILKIENVLPGVSGSFGQVDDSVLKLGPRLRELAQDLSAVERQGWSTSGVAQAFADDLEKLGEYVDASKIKEWAQEWQFVGPVLEDLTLKSRQWDGQIHELAGSMAQLAQISGDTFGGIAKGLAEVVGAWDLAAQSVKQFQEAQKADDKVGKGIAAIGLAASFAHATRPGQGKAKGALSGAAAGAAIGSIVPGFGSAVGAGVGALVGLARNWGKVSDEELKARDIIGEVNARLGGLISQSGRVEAGGVAWKETVIAAREAYIATGHSAAEAARDIGLMWDSSSQGSAAAAAAAQKVNDILDEAAKLAAERAEADTAATELAEAARVERVSKVQEELDALESRRDGLLRSVEREAPERVMGVIEKQTRAEIATLDKSIAAQRLKMDELAEEAKKSLEMKLGDIKVKIHVPIVWDIPPMPRGPSVEAPEPGDERRGFAGGTHGQYLDFGSGTPVTLHGRERVMTEAERRQGATSGMDNAELLAEMRGFRRDQLFLLPGMIAKSTAVALVKAGVR